MADLALRIRRWRTPTRLVYVGVLLVATLSPYAFDPSWANVAGRISRALDPSITASDAIDAARNLALFAGWGIVWMVTAPGIGVWISLRGAVITGTAISVTVESLQLFSSLRYASVLDLLTNAAGSAGGAVLLLGLIQVARARRGGRSYVGIPAATFAGAYAIAAFTEALIPLFRQAAYPNVYGGPLGRFRAAAELFEFSSILPIPLTDLLLFLPVGAYGVAAMVERGWSYRRAGLVVATGGAVLFAAAEVGHGFLGLPMQLGAIVAHAIGVGLGSLAAVLWLPAITRSVRGHRRVLGLMVLHCLVLCLWTWRPFLLDLSLSTIGDHLSAQWWIPLSSVGSRVDMFSVVDVVGEFLLYLPFGAILAVWPLRRHGALGAFWPGIYLAAFTELTQLFFVGRYMDLTDFLVEASGVLIGWMVIRRAGYEPYGHVLHRAGRE